VQNGKYVSERQASKYYNGITVGIDFTARISVGTKKKVFRGKG
jgi:2-keto-4-pentenoate hydratase/2-oxohepta-3-ene-1,7-dioic acid hydratase in catechol pathway